MWMLIVLQNVLCMQIEWPASFLVLAGMFASLKLDIAGEFGVGCVANTDYPNQAPCWSAHCSGWPRAYSDLISNSNANPVSKTP